MSKTAILSVRIVSDAKKAVAGFDNLAKKLDSFESKASKFGKWGAAASAAWVGMAKQAVSAASDMQQSSGAVEAVFQQQSNAVKKLASEAAQAVGLSAYQYQQFASVMGAQLKNLGIAQQELVPTTDKLITMGADLASMYGGTTQEAVEALSAAFRGEYDPIERYAMSIRKSDINARLAAKGLTGLEGEALRQAETQELLAMMTEQAGVAMGNFAREADTAEGQIQRAKAEWENAKASLGEQFLPAVTAVTQKLGEMANIIGQHPEAFKRIGLAILGFTAAMYGIVTAIKAYRTAVIAWGAVHALWTAWHGSMLATALGVYTLTAASAVANAARATAAWVTNAARTAAVWIGLKWIALTEAAASAMAWIGNAARAAGVWTLMQLRAIASFAATAAGAAVSAAMVAASWVAAVTRTIAAFVMQQGAMMAVRGATLLMAGAQAVLNAVLAANPIMLVVMAIAALVAGFVLAYNKCESFRNAVQTAVAVAVAGFKMVATFVTNLISTIATLISRASSIGGVFQTAMSIAKSAVNLLFAPFRSLISLIESVIGAISRIRFPSPPSWLGKVFGSSYGLGFTGVPSEIFKFLSPAPLTFAAAPDFTAAQAGSSAPSLISGLSSSRPMTVDNSITINVDGTGAVDPREIAARIREIFTADARTRGTLRAGGGSWAFA